MRVYADILKSHILAYTDFVWEKVEKSISKYWSICKQMFIYDLILFPRFFFRSAPKFTQRFTKGVSHGKLDQIKF